MTNLLGYASDEYFPSGIIVGSPSYNLPLTDGKSGQTIVTDGFGVSSWQTVSTSGGTSSSLSVSGTSSLTGTITSGTSILNSDGSASAPSYSFTSDTSTGIYKSGSQLIFSIGSTPTASISPGTLNAGVNQIIAGNLTCPVISSTNPSISTGTCGLTTNSIVGGSINIGSNNITCGSLISTSVFSTGFINNGTNQTLTGPITCRAINAGTYGLTCGSLSSSSITTSGRILGSSGSVGLPTYSFSSGATSGLYYTTNSQVSVSVAGADSLLVGGAASILNTTLTLGSSAFTCGAVSCSSLTTSGFITASGSISCGTNSITSGSVISSTINTASNQLMLKTSPGSTTSGIGAAIFDSGSSPPAGNFYGIGVAKQGADILQIGINKTTVSDQIPGNACYISGFGSSSMISIGRGSSATGLPSFADILITSSGVACTNGTLTTTSITSTRYKGDYYQATLQTLSTGVATYLYYDTANTNSMTYTPGSGNTTITAPVAGWYITSATVSFPINMGGSRTLTIEYNGFTKDKIQIPASVEPCSCSITAQGQLTAGQSIRISATQNSGGNLTLTVANMQCTRLFE